MSKGTDNVGNPADTKVSVKLFDGPDMSFTVPGDILWSDPKFSEVVAQGALDRYKEDTVYVFLPSFSFQQTQSSKSSSSTVYMFSYHFT